MKTLLLLCIPLVVGPSAAWLLWQFNSTRATPMRQNLEPVSSMMPAVDSTVAGPFDDLIPTNRTKRAYVFVDEGPAKWGAKPVEVDFIPDEGSRSSYSSARQRREKIDQRRRERDERILWEMQRANEVAARALRDVETERADRRFYDAIQPVPLYDPLVFELQRIREQQWHSNFQLNQTLEDIRRDFWYDSYRTSIGY